MPSKGEFLKVAYRAFNVDFGGLCGGFLRDQTWIVKRNFKRVLKGIFGNNYRPFLMDLWRLL